MKPKKQRKLEKARKRVRSEFTTLASIILEKAIRSLPDLGKIPR